MIKGLHHNAYRCRDAEQTRKFYEDFLGLPLAFVLALLLAGVASFAGGASVAQLTGRPPLQGGLRQFGLGALATSMSFLVGLLVGAHVS